ncbi:Cullin family [Novymonas esmeraldas]|uniref:Cullin family n=1 Tax=Novymonas esmeraldas TaxID=1808958 RepID=A0AAW0EX29_9TRYP
MSFTSVAGGAAGCAPLPPSLHDVNEDSAVQMVAEMLDALDTGGIALFTDAGDGRVQPLESSFMALQCSALSAVSNVEPLNTMVADALLTRAFAALSVEVDLYQSTIVACSGALTVEVVLPAFERLGTALHSIQPHLLRWCTALRAPGVASLLTVRLRCALLQADVVTGEEPPGKTALFAFLKRYGRHTLATRQHAAGYRGAEEDLHASDRGVDMDDVGSALDGDACCREGRSSSSGAGVDAASLHTGDPLMLCLHRLTLSRSAEVKQLWRSVLRGGIMERLRGVSDDFAVHSLHEELAWLQRAVRPFVCVVLPGDDQDGVAVVGSRGVRASHDGERGCGGRAARDGFCVGGGEGKLGGSAASSPPPAGAAVRAEREAWCADLQQLLLHSFARRRLDNFWEILSDYPDSVPALEDMHRCLQFHPDSGLKAELVQTVQHLLSSRLHRAGTRTEDILAILINTIHAFCILFPRNEQNSVVFAVISDTLDHLRGRKDCVSAVVHAVMQPGGTMSAAPPAPQPPLTPGAAAGADGAATGAEDEETRRVAARDRPDVLRVLLTLIRRRALVDEYQQMLAEQLLQKPMHEFDTTPEEEVLERLRQVFGEAVLDRCAVMVRDMQMSRRISQQLREQVAHRRVERPRQPRAPMPTAIAAGAAAPATSSPSASVSVLSMTTWPPLARCGSPAQSSGDAGVAAAVPLKHRPHPSLQGEMDALADAYKKLKDNQRLAWLPYLGRVELELMQRDPSKGNALVAVPHVLSLFDASVVLHVKDMASRSAGGQVQLREVATAMEVQLEELRAHVQRLSPVVLVVQPDKDVAAMQLNVATAVDVVFAQDTAATEEAVAAPAGLPPERVKLMERMVTSLLKTRGAQSSTAIHSSLRMLAKFEGSAADVVELLRSFVKQGLIVLTDTKQYALAPK